ncbi:hypothetical protein [Streptomyces sp. BA2]|uniref:hypothetical protein n=1 Tax=Streptomyces sp. BA2 TaxID=436595 RepID=UPI001324DCFE|nr:hypothetical protein [Streptomyces sp. BA2]MWA09647.1 hypothetical protein [Streptomyces sp. BA2]
MWPGERQPGGGPNQQPNPYQQPGYQQHQQPGYQQPAPWNAPTVPGGTPQAPQGSGDNGGGGGNKTKVIAVVAAAAVVVAAGVTGFLVLGGDKDDSAKPDPAKSSSEAPAPAGSGGSDSRRNDGDPKPTVPGWQTVVNPEHGIAFDVPAGWNLKSTDWVGWVSEADDPEDKPIAAFGAPAYLKEKWCGADEDRDGTKDYTSLAAAGSRGNKGAKSTDEVASKDARLWVYGAFTQPDKEKIRTGAAEPYTTKSGLKGSVATASSAGVEKKDKCDSDGKATVFAFKNSEGAFASWSFHGASGVSDEVPDATVEKMLSTVREIGAKPTS